MTEKDKKNIIITGVLVVVLIFMIANATGRVKKSKMRMGQIKSTTTTKEPTRKITAKLPAGAIIEVSKANPPAANVFSKLEQESEKLSLKRDPFSMRTISVEEQTASHGVRLCGILWDKKSPQAVINDEIVKAGDKIDDYTINAIEKDRVILSNKDGSLTLKLGE